MVSTIMTPFAHLSSTISTHNIFLKDSLLILKKKYFLDNSFLILSITSLNTQKKQSIETYPCPFGDIKYKQQCILLSGLDFLLTRDSAFKYSSYLFSMESITGCQLKIYRNINIILSRYIIGQRIQLKVGKFCS